MYDKIHYKLKKNIYIYIKYVIKKKRKNDKGGQVKQSQLPIAY